MFSKNTLSSFYEHSASHMSSLSQEDQFGKIVLVTSRQPQEPADSKKSVLQQIPQNTMQMHNSDRKNNRYHEPQKNDNNKQNIGFRMENKLCVNNRKLNNYFKEIQSNQDHKASKSSHSQNINTGYDRKSRKNRFWTKKGTSSDLLQQNATINPNSSHEKNIKFNASRKNNIKIKSRNCFSVCSVPVAESSKKVVSLNKRRQTEGNSQSVFDYKKQANIQKTYSKIITEPKRKNTLGDDKICKAYNYQKNNQLVSVSDHHQSYLGTEGQQSNINKYNLLVQRQKSIYEQLTLMKNDKKYKLSLLHNLNEQTNKVLSYLSNILLSSKQVYQQKIAHIIINHNQMNSEIFKRLLNYNEQWIRNFDYEQTVKKCIQLQQQNFKLRHQVANINVKCLSSHIDSNRKNINQATRSNKIDIQRLYNILKTNPLRLCDEDLKNNDITACRFEQICSNLIEKIAKQPIKELSQKLNKHEHNSEISKIIKQRNKSSISINSNSDSRISKSNISNKLQNDLAKNSVKCRKLIQLNTCIYSWQILSQLLPFNKNEYSSKYKKQALGFLYRISQQSNQQSITSQLIKKILSTNFSCNSNYTSILYNQLDVKIFNQVSYIFISKSSTTKIKKSILLHFLNGFSFLQNRQTVNRIVTQMDKNIGYYFRQINSVNYKNQQRVSNITQKSLHQKDHQNLISNRRLVNCMSLYEAKLKGKSTKILNQKVFNNNFAKKCQTKSISRINTKNVIPSNRDLQTIITAINIDGCQNQTQQKNVSFFDNNCNQGSQNFYEQLIDMGQCIAISYRFIVDQLIYLNSLLRQLIKQGWRQIQKNMDKLLKFSINAKKLTQMGSILKLVQLNSQIYEYIDSEKKEQQISLIDYLVFGCIRDEFIANLN